MHVEGGARQLGSSPSSVTFVPVSGTLDFPVTHFYLESGGDSNNAHLPLLLTGLIS
jgi:hypothetical protein